MDKIDPVYPENILSILSKQNAELLATYLTCMLVRRSTVLWRRRRTRRVWRIALVRTPQRKRNRGRNRHAFALRDQHRRIHDRATPPRNFDSAS